MHDPMTVAFDIKSPFGKRCKATGHVYRPTVATIWHVDPEKDGTDDSCGWFIRSRHCDQKVLERIVKRFEFDWDRVFDPNQRDDCDDGDEMPHITKSVYFCGMFKPDGMPHFSVPGIVLNLFFMAASEHFDSNGHTNWKRARRWMNEHLFDIMHFAENTMDSLFDGITRKFESGCKEEYTKTRRDERIRQMAGCVYSWILRSERPWWRHPRWHVWHWKVQIHALQNLKRWLFSRCSKCGKGFKWGYAPTSGSWNGTGPRWFRGEENVYHHDCGSHAVGAVMQNDLRN